MPIDHTPRCKQCEGRMRLTDFRFVDEPGRQGIRKLWTCNAGRGCVGFKETFEPVRDEKRLPPDRL